MMSMKQNCSCGLLDFTLPVPQYKVPIRWNELERARVGIQQLKVQRIHMELVVVLMTFYHVTGGKLEEYKHPTVKKNSEE